MKIHALIMMLGLAMLASCNTKKEEGGGEKSQAPLLQTSFSFAADSGFLTRGAFFSELQNIHPQQSAFWNTIADKDTIGRYYRDKSGSVLLCVADNCSGNHPSHAVMEVMSDGKIRQIQHFHSSGEECCWENFWEGFRKQGEDYSVKTCGSGPNLCTSRLHYFRFLMPAADISGLKESAYSTASGGGKWGRGTFGAYESEIHIMGDSMRVHYVFEKGSADESQNLHTESSAEAEFIHYYHDSAWVIEDLPVFDSLRKAFGVQ